MEEEELEAKTENNGPKATTRPISSITSGLWETVYVSVGLIAAVIVIISFITGTATFQELLDKIHGTVPGELLAVFGIFVSLIIGVSLFYYTARFLYGRQKARRKNAVLVLKEEESEFLQAVEAETDALLTERVA